MIGWLNPAALGGLVLLAVPVLVHLLRTHRAERLPFPSLRFVVASRTAAVRLRPPADLFLLLVRLAIVGAAVIAMAQPVIVTASRLRTWNARLARAIVVDASAAMNVVDPAGKRPADDARDAVDAEARSAAQAVRIDSVDLRDGIVQAAGWLATTAPARREIVVISAFTAGAFRESDRADVPDGVGLRFLRVGRQIDARQIAGARLFAAPGLPQTVQEIRLTGPRTGVRLIREPAALAGLRIVGADSAAEQVQRLLRAVATAGAPTPSADEALICQFGAAGGDPAAAPFEPTTPRWMLRALIRLQDDEALREASRTVTASSLAASDRWSLVSSDPDGRPLVRVAVGSGALVMQVGAPADTFVAAVALRALLVARGGDGARPDQEILRTPPDVLAAWSRPASETDREIWRRADRSDGRWFWIVALVLLGVEQRLRRTAREMPAEVRDAA